MCSRLVQATSRGREVQTMKEARAGYSRLIFSVLAEIRTANCLKLFFLQNETVIDSE
jgi:hypothetical protein